MDLTDQQPSAEHPTLRVEVWPDPVIDRLGHDPRSDYVEHFWLPILGPSTTLLLRRLAHFLDSEPAGVEIDFVATARSLGLGTRTGRHGPFHRALDRCVQFGLAQRTHSRFVVRRHLPPLSQGQIRRLPPELQQDHRHWEQRSAGGSDRTALHRARRLALTLVELGESAEDASRQLDLWRFGPTVVRDAVAWAVANRTSRPNPTPSEAA